MINYDLIRSGVTDILKGLGCDLNDPNFKETPYRVASMYKDEIFLGCGSFADDEIADLLGNTFPCDHDQLVVARGIDVYGMCPHHLLPVKYSIVAAYMPGAAPDGRVVGLSKVYRLASLLAARPVLQEKMVNDIADALMLIPGCQGAGTIAHGEHMCVRMRGVRQVNSVVTTSSLRGIFLHNAPIRAEFLSLLR